MKEITSRPDDFNIYCTDADSINHNLSCAKAEKLLQQIKVCSLLGKHVYISGGHIYENPETARLLLGNPELLESGIVVLGLRDECRDFQDLFDLQMSHGKNILLTHADIPKFLNAKTSVIMRWSAPDTQPRFKQIIQKSIEDTNSILRRRLRVGVKKTAIKNLIDEIEALPPENVTRETIQNLVRNHIPHRCKAFMSEVNLLYYITGSTDLIPHLSQSLFSDLKHGYLESLDYDKYPIPAEDLFSNLLKTAFISDQVIDQLSITTLVEFREKYSKLLRQFRRKWWSTVGVGDPCIDATLSTESTGEIQSLLKEEILRETKKIKTYKKITHSIGISSLIISGASLFAANPVIGAISFLISCGAFAAEADPLKNAVLRAPLTAFTTNLRMWCTDKQTPTSLIQPT